MTGRSTKAKQVNLLGASTFITLLFMGLSTAQAQQVVFSGDNGTHSNGCHGPTPVPATCATQVFAPMAPFTDTNHSFDTNYQHGILVGTNLTNANGGPAASGTGYVSGGAQVTGAFIHIGHEENTIGELVLTDSGTHWDVVSGTTVGNSGTGTLRVEGGATFLQHNPDYFYVGYGATGKGYLTITGVDAAGQRSYVQVQNQAHFGEQGQAEVQILDGGYFSALYTSTLGAGNGGNGVMTVSGVHQASGIASTVEILNNQFWIGYENSKGTLNILDGGQVNVQDGIHVRGNDSVLIVNGVDAGTGIRSTLTSNSINVGLLDSGSAHILNGGLITNDISRVGTNFGSVGVLNIDGVDTASGHRSTLNAVTRFVLGYVGSGTVNITNGGLAQSGGLTVLGEHSIGVGNLNISGPGSQLVSTSFGYIGNSGSASLTLSDGGVFKAPSTIIASYPGSSGVLYIGTGGKAGVIDTDDVFGGNGTAMVVFNHTDNITFTPSLTGTMTVNKNNIGNVLLNDKSTYQGYTNINEGVFQAGVVDAFSLNSRYVVGPSGTLHLNGLNQQIYGLDVQGYTVFGGAGGTVLTIRDKLISNGGHIEMHTVLGDDSSVTDKIITDSTQGDAYLFVQNSGGMGAPTSEGIKIIDVISGPSDAVYTLSGDYSHEGQDVVVGGAYAYKLYKGGTSTPNDGDWYLRSQLAPTPPSPGGGGRALPDPLYQAGVPSYEVYPQALLAMNELSSLQERVGNRAWAITDKNQGLSSSADGTQTYTVPQIENGGVWTRVEGLHNYSKPHASKPVKDFTQNMVKAQVGLDILFSEMESGKLIGGVFGQYVHSKTEVASRHGDGELKTKGYGGGVSLTWYQNDDSYVDLQAQGTFYKSDINSKMLNRPITKDNDGIGYAASAEYGTRVKMDDDWSVTPQAQLTYSHVSFDKFIDPYGSQVDTHRGNSLQSRAGLTADHEHQWYGSNGKTHSQHLYALANIHYEFLQGTSVDVSNTKFTTDNDKLWGGFGVGGSQNWNDGKFSLYGEAMAKTPLKHFGDSYTVKGTVGMRVKW